MAAPEVPIEVDPETGVWSSDGLPMIYLPRHFFVNNHRAIEEVLGQAAYARLLFEAGHRSAYDWCARAAETSGLDGLDVFRLYLKRLSQRGWGRFSLLSVDAEAGSARIRLDHSVFVLEERRKAGRKLCYMFAGWPAGALAWVRERAGRPLELAGAEVQCAAEGSHDHCLLEARPAKAA